ncbi:MAG: cupin domain-containing protein [Candidatus Cloacimonetes bacterium]|nr:cupin domain-containing protein [Candidatus Cloacimonadota bacterium]
MKITHYSQVDLENVEMEGARGARIRWLISDKDGAPNFATRLFEVDPGGFTPYHSHSWEHENFIVAGEGVLTTANGEFPFHPGDVIYVEPNLKHNYRNTGKDILKFLCIIPLNKSKKQEKKIINPFAAGVASNC